MKAVLRYLGAKNRLADWIVPFFRNIKSMSNHTEVLRLSS